MVDSNVRIKPPSSFVGILTSLFRNLGIFRPKKMPKAADSSPKPPNDPQLWGGLVSGWLFCTIMLPAARQGMQIDGFSYDHDGFFVGFLFFLRFDIMKRQQLMMEEKHPRKRKTSVEPFSLRPSKWQRHLRSPTTAFERAWDGRSRLVCCIKPMSKSQKGDRACFQTPDCVGFVVLWFSYFKIGLCWHSSHFNLHLHLGVHIQKIMS